MTPPTSGTTKLLPTPLTLTPIGVIRTPWKEKREAPRQGSVAPDVQGRLELLPGKNYEHALDDIDGWDFLWVLYWFHHNEGWRPKVLPPRSRKRRGVFATRAPHRPNPLGLTAVRLERREGLTLHVRGVDMLDGTPLLDIKPYVPAADARPNARAGWLGSLTAPDPEPGFEVRWSRRAREQASWLGREHGIELEAAATRVLAIGPQPHPYRRIRKEGEGFRLAIKDWRLRFVVDGRRVTVEAIASGYRESELAKEGEDRTMAAHRAFVARFV